MLIHLIHSKKKLKQKTKTKKQTKQNKDSYVTLCQIIVLHPLIFHSHSLICRLLLNSYFLNSSVSNISKNATL